MNLLDNAIAHTRNGTVIIKIISFKQNLIKVIIKDTGSGISEEISKNMFDIFKL